MSIEEASWPPPPTNIRIQRRSGEVIPVDCIFSRWQDGTAVWEVIWSGDHLDFGAGDHLLIEKLPSNTSLVLSQEL